MPQTTSKASQTASTTGFSWDDVAALKTQRETEAVANQQAYLAQNPDYAPCVIPGCTGVVGPNYVTVLNGVRTGFCPRTRVHATLKAEHEASKRRSL